ncbi:MAG: ribosomal subunit interface protein [Desulfobacterales bacterium RIFOXYA12_FULL_46_15]|nr:MAG: ribosomal subunit interface protein [Desulfobacula sp. GWF2_41_7]OGR22202.1 MAG: ribosomal subunit interface protein [Desulfobacterales bacterium RIFOXYA12_FULL_46_15]
MQTTVTFKQIDPSSSLKSYVQKKLEKFDKMLESPADAYVVLTVEKIRHIAEITLTCDKVKIHAKEESDSMYSSIDALMDKVRIQIKKNKEKVKHHMSGKKQSIKNDITGEISVEPEPAKDISDPQIILETIDYKPMDIEDAVIELNSGIQPFFVFNNARTECVNVLYKHNNGKLGLIQPKG